MTYDIAFAATTTDGTVLGTVYLPHAPEDADKIIGIREAALRGEAMRPVILMDAGDHHIAFSGAHRIAALAGLDGLLNVVMLPEDLSQDEFDLIDRAYDDDDLLAALEEVAAARDDMSDVLEAMRAEVASNNA